MAAIKTIKIDGKEVSFKISTDVPKIYRMKFNRDFYKDLNELKKRISKNKGDESSLDIYSFEIFENIAYVMAKHADPSISDTLEDWLDEFTASSIYQTLPSIIELCNIKP